MTSAPRRRRAVVEDMTEEELAIFDLLTKPRAGPRRRASGRWSRRAPSACWPTCTTSWSSTGGARRRRPPRSARPSATSWTPTCRPTPTRPSCSTPRSRRCSTTSSAPTATTAPACTPTTTSAASTGGGGVAVLEPRRTSTRITAQRGGADQGRRRVRVARWPSSSASPGSARFADRRRAHRQRRGLRRRVQVDRPLGPSRGRADKVMEDAVVKTVAGFLNTDGGTLLIGVGPDREVGRPRPRLPEGEAPER